MEKMLENELIAKLEATVKTQAAMIAELQTLIKYYEEQFKLSQRRRFGQSSEQTPDQLSFDNLFNEIEDQTDPELPEPSYEEITYKRKKRAGKREDDLSGLPVERIDYELPESERICSVCGDTMTGIGVTVRDELEVIPAKVIHKEHAVHAYGCQNCGKNSDKNVVVRADAPKPLISGSLASPSAVAYIASQKYVNGIPLYRTEKGLTYDGVVLSRQTMANWLIYCSANYLLAVYSKLVSLLLEEDIANADETTVQVLHEPGREAKTKSYEWLYRTGKHAKRQIVIYEYRETRKQDHPREFLKGFKGYLQTDGYQCYHNLPPDIISVGCWSHARRPWEELYETLDKDNRAGSNAERGLLFINLLFWFEYDFRDLSAEERYEKRLKYSKPISDDFFDWIGTLNPLPKSKLGEAVTYALSQRKYLENVFLDGRLELSNNVAERAIRPFVQGRKQWLFSNTPNGAEASSIYYSLIETAKENNLNPYQYLKFLLEMLPNATTNELDSFLPWSDSLPVHCRVPLKTSNVKSDKPMYAGKNGPLHLALLKLREKYLGNAGSGGGGSVS
jgi:transposase